MYKGYKIRIYPTKEQEDLIWKHIHTCRFIWNYMLETHKKHYNETGKCLSRYDMIKLLTPLKKQEGFEWIRETSNASLQKMCIRLDLSFKKFFKHKAHYPKFKSKKTSTPRYPVRESNMVIGDNYIRVEKIHEIKAKVPKIINGKIINPSISLINGKWLLSFIVQCDNQTRKTTNYSMGIDLGIKELAVVSFNNQRIIYHNINKSKRVKTLEHKLAHIKRVINRKYRSNHNYEKSKAILKYKKIESEIYYKLFNIRHNYIHQTTHALVSMLPSVVVMEDLDILDMLKNKYIAKELQKQCLFEFIKQMQYKCEWNGIKFVQVDRYFPSSKMCSSCGTIKNNLKLSDRIYKCSCGLTIDRDYNAAINLMKYIDYME